MKPKEEIVPMKFTSLSPDDTRSLSASLAKKAEAGCVYALIGTLGSGKTEFVRGFVSALSAQTKVRSPSFPIVISYQTDAFTIHHFDFYRLNSPEELIEIGFTEYIEDDRAVSLIEWADLFPEILPDNTRYIRITEDESHRRVIIY